MAFPSTIMTPIRRHRRPVIFFTVVSFVVINIVLAGMYFLERLHMPALHPAYAMTRMPSHICDDINQHQQQHKLVANVSREATAGVAATAAAAAAAAATSAAVIPNLVHYVWILKTPGVLRFNFLAFVSAYSAHLFINPDKIYVHTDATPEIWERAKTAGDPWTRRFLAIPNLTPHHVVPPTRTSEGVEIEKLAHRADFLRVSALVKFGGLYLDYDAIPLRDVAPLRHAGFETVLGGEYALLPRFSGFINNGIMMSRPHAMLMEIYYQALHVFFDGVWTTPLRILTDLAYRLTRLPGTVVVLHTTAFAPFSWEWEDTQRLWRPHGEAPEERAPLELPKLANEQGTTCQDAMQWLRDRERPGVTESWETDFSSVYVLHAFAHDTDRMRGWDGQINPRYVLERRSNFARAVYPAVVRAVQEGIIPKEEL